MAKPNWLIFPAVVLHFLIWWNTRLPQPAVASATVLLCLLMPRYKKIFVIFSTLLMGLFLAGNLYSFSGYTWIYSPFALSSKFQKYEATLPIPFVNISGYLIYILLSALIYFAYRRLFRRLSLAGTLFILFSALGFLFIGSTVDTGSPVLFLFAIGTAVLSKHIWYLMLLCKDLPKAPTGQAHLVLTNILPFWTMSTEAREHLDLQKYAQTPSESEAEKNLKSGGQRLLWVAFWYFILMVLKIGTSTLLTSEFVGTDFGVRFEGVVFSIYKTWTTQPVWKIWTSIFAFGSVVLVEHFLVYGQMLVATAHFCGYRIADYSDHPWKSTSFLNFFGRTMYYYNYIILTYFYFPLLQLTKPWNLNRKLRIVLCLPLSVFLGGYLFHFMRDTYRPLQFGLLNTFDFYNRNLAPYLIFLCIALVISAVWPTRQMTVPRAEWSFKHVSRVLFYVAIYCIGMWLNCSYFFGGLRTYPQVLLYLFGISH